MKISRLICAMCVFLGSLIISTISAAVLVDKQPMPGSDYGGLNSNVGLDFERMADDFTLSDAAKVNRVSWYGWFLDGAILTGEFDILFYDDIGVPKNPPFYSTTVTSVTGIDTGIKTSFGIPIFKWTASIPPVNFSSSGNYWISIQGHADINDFNTTWIWTFSGQMEGESGAAFQNEGTVSWSVSSLTDALAFTLEESIEPFDIGGTIKTVSGTDICAMVLASGQYMFSCNPPGVMSLTDLPRENNGTVKRQIYADGFFPKVDILSDSTNEAVVMTRSGICPSYNTPYDPAFVAGSAGKRINIVGNVLVQDSQTPVCAMVLANGQYMFSCDGTGSYALNIPLDTNGQFKLQVYADGFAPTIQRFDEFSANNDVRMARAVECQ